MQSLLGEGGGGRFWANNEGGDGGRGGTRGGKRTEQECTLGEGQWSAGKGAGRVQRRALAQLPAPPCHQA